MGTRGRACAWACTAAVGVLALAGCGSSDSGGSSGTTGGTAASTTSGSKEPVKIAAFGYTQGTLKGFGEESLGGIKLAVEQANANGGILGGRPVELKVYEEGLNAGTTTDSIRRAKSDGVAGAVGFLDATSATVAASLSDKLDMPIVIAGAGTGTFVADNSRADLAHVLTYPEALYPALGTWIKDQGAKKVVHIAYDSTYSRIAEKVHRQSFGADSGVDFPATIYVPYGQADVSEAVSKAVAEKPDVILFDIWGDATVGAVKRMAELGFKGDVIQSTVSLVDQQMKAAGDAVCGDITFMDTEYFYPSAEVPASETFVADLKKAGLTLGGQTEPFYEGAQILLNAIDKAGSADDRDAIGKAMRESNFDTPRGTPMEVLPNGQVYVPSWDLVKWDCDSQSRQVVEKLDMPKSDFDTSKIVTDVK